MTLKECAEVFITLFGNHPPCSYSGVEENINCKWCKNNCGNVSPSECWEYAIINGWV